MCVLSSYESSNYCHERVQEHSENSRYDTGDKDTHTVMATHGTIAEFFSSQET